MGVVWGEIPSIAQGLLLLWAQGPLLVVLGEWPVMPWTWTRVDLNQILANPLIYTMSPAHLFVFLLKHTVIYIIIYVSSRYENQDVHVQVTLNSHLKVRLYPSLHNHLLHRPGEKQMWRLRSCLWLTPVWSLALHGLQHHWLWPLNTEPGRDPRTIEYSLKKKQKQQPSIFSFIPIYPPPPAICIFWIEICQVF